MYWCTSGPLCSCFVWWHTHQCLGGSVSSETLKLKKYLRYCVKIKGPFFFKMLPFRLNLWNPTQKRHDRLSIDCSRSSILWFWRSVYVIAKRKHLYSCAHLGSRCIRQDRNTGSRQGCWHKRVSRVSQPGHCGTAHIHRYLKRTAHADNILNKSMAFYVCVFMSVSGSGWQVPVQVLLSLPEMVYPGSQVQWVVPCVIVQRDGRTRGPLVAAGIVEAAAVAGEAAAEVFIIVTKTE